MTFSGPPGGVQAAEDGSWNLRLFSISGARLGRSRSGFSFSPLNQPGAAPFVLALDVRIASRRRGLGILLLFCAEREDKEQKKKKYSGREDSSVDSGSPRPGIKVSGRHGNVNEDPRSRRWRSLLPNDFSHICCLIPVPFPRIPCVACGAAPSIIWVPELLQPSPRERRAFSTAALPLADPAAY